MQVSLWSDVFSSAELVINLFLDQGCQDFNLAVKSEIPKRHEAETVTIIMHSFIDQKC